MVGKILGNRYEIVGELGGGGMAIVYKGRDKYLNRLVTIKILRPEFTADKDFVNRFQREAQSVASLSHPNIVSIYDVGQEDNIYYLIMEYVHGANLKTVIKNEGPLSPERAARIAMQICEALEHAHGNNIVHRDVKPHNILITYGGWAKLTDFGIAREISATTFTYTDTIVGSVHYISPEQARGQAVGPKSDLYSLGVVLYEMLTGKVPYQGESPIAIAIKHIQEEAEPPSRLNPGLNTGLEKIILKAINKDPDLRFQSAREMFTYLQAAASNGESKDLCSKNDDDMATQILPAIDKVIEKKQLEKGSKRRRMWPLGWVFSGILLLAIILAGGYYLEKYYLNLPDIQVPDVVHKSYDAAKKELNDLGLTNVVKKEGYSPDVRVGYVMAQSIGPNDPKVKLQREIILTVSLGPEMRVVPDLYQLDVTRARDKLAGEGLKLNEQTKEDFSENVPHGCIFKQEPQAQIEVPKGSAVTVYLSKGPPVVQIQAPDLTGLTVEQARAALSEKKLKLDDNIALATNYQYLTGQVVAQDPVASNPVQEGATVKITVSSGPGPSPKNARITIDVPDDRQAHQVRISVTDLRGTNDWYIRSHSPGDKIKEDVHFYGKATISVYIDNSLVKTKTYS